MIKSWSGKEAKAIFQGRQLKSLSTATAQAARRRLAALNAVTSVEALRSPPSNRLHKVGERWSISVNMQFRITFVWGEHGPEDVWFGDYH